MESREENMKSGIGRSMVAAVGAFVALALASTAQAEMAALPGGHGAYAFRCANNEQIRIIFNQERHTVVVGRIRRPDVTLQQADAQTGFRFRRDDAYELAGDMQQMHWRVGSGEPVVCYRGEH